MPAQEATLAPYIELIPSSHLSFKLTRVTNACGTWDDKFDKTFVLKENFGQK